ncbi:SusC/RagA family TonB-linked outer membrane protein [Parapedobacter lycopersici]|uniref:SusC/RagA family TonB-linked outer membrane protein n=1 Tax=Parapedobacter lycopersici TaxID=1864939 RepID=UPI00214D653E|nr:SusC/RagA family TonB-linked outer membrane protein [Parapedobacter lycopersici]
MYTIWKNRQSKGLLWWLQFKRIAMVFSFSMAILQVETAVANQTQLITLKRSKADLREILEEINQQTGYLTLANARFLDNAKPVDVDFVRTPLDVALDKILEGQKLSFEIEGKEIILKPVRDEEQRDPPSSRQGTVPAARQNGVSGRVTDSLGNPISGVTVRVTDGPQGTTTDNNGMYSLELPTTVKQLEFSYLGYVTQVATIQSGTLNITLAAYSQQLESAVVTALGIVRQAKSLTYSAQVIDGSSMDEARETNMINSLQGKVAGVVISRSATGPGGSSKVLLRGSRSITGNNEPLYIIDGVPLNSGSRASGGTSFGGRDGGGGISMLNPDNIESMTVLKGASAAALYGSLGQNGAIIITTKSGKSGKITVDYNGGMTLDQAVALPEFQYVYGQGDGGVYSPNSERSYGPKADGQEVTLWNGNVVPYVGHPDNVKNFLRTAKTVTNSVSASGGNERMRTFFSYGNVVAEGILRNNDMVRHNIDLKLDNTISDRLSFTTKISYIYSEIDNMPHTGERGYALSSILRAPVSIPLDQMKDFAYIDEEGVERQSYWNPGSSILSNPYWNLNREIFHEKKDRVLGLFSARYRFNDWIDLLVRGSIDKTMEKTENKIYNDTYTTYGLGSNYITGDYSRQSTNVDALLSLQRDLTPSINLSANLGASLQQGSATSMSVDANGLNKQNYFFLVNARSPLTDNNFVQSPQVQSVYATATLSYNDYLFLDVTARNDWSSALPPGNQSYFYPSVGLSGILTDMLSFPSWVTYGKVRLSLAYSGSGGSAYRDRNYYAVARGGLVSTPSTRSLPTYKPELTSAFEIGAEWRFFNSRFGFDFTYYNTDTKNQLITISTPAASLFANQYINAGLINNHGVEATVNVVPIRTGEFSWDATLNFSKNVNKVERLTDEVTRAIIVDDRQVLIDAAVGGSYGDMWGMGWQRDEQGRPLVSDQGLPLLTAGKTVYLGNYNPNYNLGFNNSLAYKELSLSFLIDYRNGGTVIAGTQALLDADGHSKASLWGREEGIILDAYTVEGEKNTTSITPQSYFGTVGERYPAGEFYAYSGSSIRLREVVLGYRLTGLISQNGWVKDAKISLIGRNLFFFSREAPFDPELVSGTGNYGGIEYNSLPATRNIGLNVKLTF